MAVVTRYFSTASAGTGDGSSWANRAALFSGGAWSTVITGFNFSTGSDSLYCLIEGAKTYTITALLQATTFTSGAPTIGRPLIFHGCDSSGNPLAAPDGNWTSDQPIYDTSTFPTLSATTNLTLIDINYNTTHLRYFKISSTGSTTNPVIRNCSFYYCYVTCSASNTSLVVANTTASAENSVFEATGTSYSAICSAEAISNCRIVGNSSATSGNRNGLLISTANVRVVRVTSINNVGSGILLNTSTSSSSIYVYNCMVHGNGYGIRFPSTVTQSGMQRVLGCYIAGSTTAGIDGQSQSYITMFGNRLRDNGTSGNFLSQAGNSLTNESDNINYTTDSDDASELVNVAGGDYRIKNTATIWGMGFGVSEQPAASTAGGSFVFIG